MSVSWFHSQQVQMRRACAGETTQINCPLLSLKYLAIRAWIWEVTGVFSLNQLKLSVSVNYNWSQLKQWLFLYRKAMCQYHIRHLQAKAEITSLGLQCSLLGPYPAHWPLSVSTCPLLPAFLCLWCSEPILLSHPWLLCNVVLTPSREHFLTDFLLPGCSHLEELSRARWGWVRSSYCHRRHRSCRSSYSLQELFLAEALHVHCPGF